MNHHLFYLFLCIINLLIPIVHVYLAIDILPILCGSFVFYFSKCGKHSRWAFEHSVPVKLLFFFHIRKGRKEGTG